MHEQERAAVQEGHTIIALIGELLNEALHMARGRAGQGKLTRVLYWTGVVPC